MACIPTACAEDPSRTLHSCIVRHLFKIDIEPYKLLSNSTALRFADVGHALSKMLILDEMKSQLFDLHMDDTSREGTKIVGHQITLQNGKQMSMGYSAVDREDANTLIDKREKLICI